jgi:hypothetical protein
MLFIFEFVTMYREDKVTPDPLVTRGSQQQHGLVFQSSYHS